MEKGYILVSGCAGDTRPAAGTFGDFLFSPRHFGDFHFAARGPLDGKKTLSNASTVVENQTFGAGMTKKMFLTHLISNLYNMLIYMVLNYYYNNNYF